MKLHHLRNATFMIESGEISILIDPMLSDKGRLPPFAYFKHKAIRNPIVSLPDVASEVLDKTTHCFVTHSQKFGIKALQHTDHLDDAGEAFLRERAIPVVTCERDASSLRGRGLNVVVALKYWRPEDLLGGRIAAIPALHGHGWMRCLMANGAGFYLELPGEPSIYISGDTVYTDSVERVLTEFKPDIAVMASGGASLDVGRPILMPLEELVTFVQNAPNRVVANHLEALNHCPTTRLQLKRKLENSCLLSKVIIPNDGEAIVIEKGSI